FPEYVVLHFPCTEHISQDIALSGGHGSSSSFLFFTLAQFIIVLCRPASLTLILARSHPKILASIFFWLCPSYLFPSPHKPRPRVEQHRDGFHQDQACRRQGSLGSPGPSYRYQDPRESPTRRRIHAGQRPGSHHDHA
ncbi:hypothetical protein QBC39DRAFT_383536, partial [Podospora conica]